MMGSSIILTSDNTAGVHSHIIDAIARANIEGAALPYGNDPYTQEAKRVLKQLLGVSECQIALVTTGTAANVIAMASALKSFEAIITPDSGHMWTDEAGAVERCTQSRIIPVPTQGKKLTVDHISSVLKEFPLNGPCHKVRPKVVSISQTTEFGLVYTPREIRELSRFIHQEGMLFHVDGARISNAAVKFDYFYDAIGGENPDQYVDLFSVGGTKNGAMCAEAVVFMGRAKELYSPHIHKQAMQLLSKQRFIAAQLIELYGTGLWKENALKANNAAKAVAGILSKYGQDRIQFSYPTVEANAIFVALPEEFLRPFMERCHCYLWDVKSHTVRLMTSWMTTDDDIAVFENIVREIFSVDRVGNKS